MPPRPTVFEGIKPPEDAVNDRPFLARPQPWKGGRGFILIGDRR